MGQFLVQRSESYRLWCVVVCDLERTRRPWPQSGLLRQRKKVVVVAAAVVVVVVVVQLEIQSVAPPNASYSNCSPSQCLQQYCTPCHCASAVLLNF
jgi:hypothetical protein